MTPVFPCNEEHGEDELLIIVLESYFKGETCQNSFLQVLLISSLKKPKHDTSRTIRRNYGQDNNTFKSLSPRNGAEDNQ